MNYRNGIGSSLPGANFTTLPQTKAQNPDTELKSALRDFLLAHPELAADPRKMEVLQYCYKHYVNYDPEMRDLNILEKLERANQMARDFLGSMFNL